MGTLKGKHLIFLGSSVTYGSATGGISFADFIAENNCCTMTKEAVSGTTLADVEEISYISRLKKIRDQKADLFICQLSTNDATRKLPLGEVSEGFDKEGFDTKTVAGAIEYIIAYAKEKWNCPVIFYTNPRYDSEIYEAMVALLCDIAAKWDVTLIDLWEDRKINNFTEEETKKYMADPIHPTVKGYRDIWTPIFEEVLIKALA
ncbi:MAG: SGNH/GDSL hydrolase family protein [Lachnospiraceae bacterium]|nr:SGNH/GDSL hydrolase family protein [Lachnospiraceae bacterium]